MRVRRILVVDDDRGSLDACARALRTLPDSEVEPEERSADALRRLGTEPWDLVVTDLRMPGADGMDLLKVARAQDPDMPVLLLTGFPTVDTAVAALKSGATDYLTKPIDVDELLVVAERALRDRAMRAEHEVLERQLRSGSPATEIVGVSDAIVGVLELSRRFAESDLDVLIVGETGTGKELFARRIHELTTDRDGRFVAVDCGAIPADLMESELFGHQKGAFTGADRTAMGLLEFAHGGTFFLDEVQSLDRTLQAKLLRVLQERKIRRVGSTREQEVDVRIVAAMSVSPEKLVEDDRLREDLMYRLNVGRIDLPPLRSRTEDIPLLVERFLQRYATDGQPVKVEDHAMAVLRAYDWPGNVRQLENTIRRCLVTASGTSLGVADLPGSVVDAAGPDTSGATAFFDARQARIDAFEREFLTAALRQHDGNVREASKDVDVPRGTFYRLLKKHGIQPKRFKRES